MTTRMMEKINGCQLVQLGPREWGAIEGTTLRATVEARNEKTAIFLLSEEVLRQNRAAAMRRDGYRCVRCGSMRNLQAHHERHRKMGASQRDDHVDNLLTVCSSCHGAIHGGRRGSA